jgi:lysyl-tRNA synthetase class II
MKKLIEVLIVCTLVAFMGGTASGETLKGKDNIVKAISIEQFFADGKDRTGKIVYVNGPVIKLSYDEDPFSDKKEISSLMLQKENWKVSIILNKNLPSGTLKEGSNATVKFTTRPIVNSFTLVKGEVVHGNVKIVKWSSKEKPKLEDSVTIENYFSKKLRFGNKRVTLEGTVVEFSKAGSGEVRIELSGLDNNSIQVYIDQRVWKKKEIKDILKTLKEGDRVNIRGTFMVEGGTMAVFTGTTLSKK